ncbi:MAG: AzlC family ABC transporter permease [Anaerolineales bacterium]|nr:AzlC family ABC transporter permease [Anaerolineales bacterium]
MSEAKKNFIDGLKGVLPLLVGVFPFGMIYGALAMNAGLSTSAAQMMSSILFAGSSQFVTAQLAKESAPALVIILTIAVVNIRHMLYSASLAPYLKDLSTKWKALLAYLLTDEAYAPSILKYEKDGITPFGHWFLLGAGLGLWFTWQISTALGIFLVNYLTQNDILKNIPLDFALPLTFIAMVVPALKNKPMVAAALSAGIMALLTYALPFKLGLILAAITGIIVGSVLEKK